MNFGNSLSQDQPDYTVSELQRGLINDLSWLLKESNDYNMIINVGEPPNIKSFRVHTSVLKARSLYFRALLSGGHHFSSKGKNSLVEITQENIKPDSFEVMLNYIYTGTISFGSEKDTRNLFEYIIAAEKLWLFPLIQYIENYLIHQMDDWLKSNFVYLLTTIRSNQKSFKLLHEFAEDILKNHPHLLFDSNDFHTLPESILMNLLQRRNFSKDVPEKEILAVILDWGIKQNNDLIDKDVNNWNSKDFSKLQTSLQRCIPLIRYTSIPPEVFFKIMSPYRPIFTLGLYERIMQIPMYVSYSKLVCPPVPPRSSSPAHSISKQPTYPSTPLASILQEFPRPPTTTPPISRSNSPIDYTPRSGYNRTLSGLNPHKTLSAPVTSKHHLIASSAMIRPRSTVRRKAKSLSLSNKPRILLVKRANTLPMMSRRKPKQISVYSIETSNNSSSPIKAKLKRSSTITPSKSQSPNLSKFESITPSRSQSPNLSKFEPITSSRSQSPNLSKNTLSRSQSPNLLKNTPSRSQSPNLLRNTPSRSQSPNLSKNTPSRSQSPPQIIVNMNSLVKEDFGKDQNIETSQVPLKVLDTSPLIIRKDSKRKASNRTLPGTPISPISPISPMSPITPMTPITPITPMSPTTMTPTTPINSVQIFEPQVISASQPIIHKEEFDKKALYRKISIVSSNRPLTPIMI